MKLFPKLILFFLVIANAEIGHTDILAYSVAPCSFWMPDGGHGYVCTNFPATIQVPQAQSVASALRDQNARIAELEKRIAALEKACQQ